MRADRISGRHDATTARNMLLRANSECTAHHGLLWRIDRCGGTTTIHNSRTKSATAPYPADDVVLADTVGIALQVVLDG